MKRAVLAVVGVAFVIGAASGYAPAPIASSAEWNNLAAPQRILDGNKPINVDVGHAAPAVFDFNRDGKKDLLVGQFDGGKVRIYLNRGSSAAPKFQGFTYLAINGKPVSVPYG